MAPWSLQRSFRWLFLQQLDLRWFGNSHHSQTAPTPIKYCRLKIISDGLAMFGHSTTILCCLFQAYNKWTTNKNKHWNKTLKHTTNRNKQLQIYLREIPCSYSHVTVEVHCGQSCTSTALPSWAGIDVSDARKWIWFDSSDVTVSMYKNASLQLDSICS